MKKIRYCGECREFAYEDSSGYGICTLDNEIRSCSERCMYNKTTEKS